MANNDVNSSCFVTKSFYLVSFNYNFKINKFSIYFTKKFAQHLMRIPQAPNFVKKIVNKIVYLYRDYGKIIAKITPKK